MKVFLYILYLCPTLQYLHSVEAIHSVDSLATGAAVHQNMNLKYLGKIRV